MRCISNFSFLGDKITVIIRNFVVSSYHRQESKHNHYFNLSCKGDYDHGYEILQMFPLRATSLPTFRTTVLKLSAGGEEMKEMVANTTDAATEKHVPVVTVDGNQVTVSVGSVTHPMEEKHYIQWISLQTEQGNQRKALKPVRSPPVTFPPWLPATSSWPPMSTATSTACGRRHNLV